MKYLLIPGLLALSSAVFAQQINFCGQVVVVGLAFSEPNGAVMKVGPKDDPDAGFPGDSCGSGGRICLDSGGEYLTPELARIVIDAVREYREQNVSFSVAVNDEVFPESCQGLLPAVHEVAEGEK